MNILNEGFTEAQVIAIYASLVDFYVLRCDQSTY